MRLEKLTFFRFIAAFIVVIFHYGKQTSLALLAKPFLISGPQMVTFFFVLSGFVMVISQLPKKSFTTNNYYIRRIARIAPVYIFALIIMIGYTYGKNHLNNNLGIFLSLTFLQSWFTKYSLTFNGPGWSLSVEMFFYLLFPLFFYWFREKKVNYKKLLLFALLFWLFTQFVLINLLNSNQYKGFPSDTHALINYFPISHLCSFILGMSVGYVFLNKEAILNFSKSRNFIYFILFVCSSLLAYLMLQNPMYLKRLLNCNLPYGSSFYAPIFSILILSLALSENSFTKFLSLKLFVILGEASYGLYILQKPIYVMYTRHIQPSFDFSLDVNFYLYSLALIFISIISLYCIEKPMQKLILNYSK